MKDLPPQASPWVVGSPVHVAFPIPPWLDRWEAAVWLLGVLLPNKSESRLSLYVSVVASGN